MRSVGVEEELLLVDAGTGEPRAVSAAVLAAADREAATEGPGEHTFEAELQGQQLEFATRPHTSMADVAAEVVRLRAAAARHAERSGASVVALATSPVPAGPALTPDGRYRWLLEEFGLSAREQLTCGCHVHVSVASDEEGVAVLDRIGPWLPVLLALSANSPFWQGQDTGYASYRSRVWNRWPMAGAVGPFGSADAYHEQVAAMVRTGVLRDRGMVYFDARLSHRYPTVEIRVADVCLDTETTALLATLTRGLVDTAARDWREGRSAPGHSVALLRLAGWRAGRSGFDGELLHPGTMDPEPAGQVVDALLAHVRDALDDNGDLADATARLAALRGRGTGARVQRELMRRTGSLRDVVAECARRTCR